MKAAKTGDFNGIPITAGDLLQKLAHGNTLAHVAALNGKLAELLEALLTQAGVSIKNEASETICELAARHRNAENSALVKAVKYAAEKEARRLAQARRDEESQAKAEAHCVERAGRRIEEQPAKAEDRRLADARRIEESQARAGNRRLERARSEESRRIAQIQKDAARRASRRGATVDDIADDLFWNVFGGKPPPENPKAEEPK
jgi:membrane protein involved in colicin uptake